MNSSTGEIKADGLRLSLYKCGETIYKKTRHPTTYGVYSEIETDDALYRFNLNNEIVFIQGRTPQWPSSREWLKRSCGNDWIYYSAGGYRGSYETFGQDRLREPINFKIPSPYNEIYKATGEYYLPTLPYISNAILGSDASTRTEVQGLISAWYEKLKSALEPLTGLPPSFADFVTGVSAELTGETGRKGATTVSYSRRPPFGPAPPVHAMS
ncbi:MAG TPA: hypothetical protein ENN41_00885, partial [Sediminispirochaeta sp.]|nr:hypothetical protein [Sediminispirochaeta sp.]